MSFDRRDPSTIMVTNSSTQPGSAPQAVNATAFFTAEPVPVSVIPLPEVSNFGSATELNGGANVGFGGAPIFCSASDLCFAQLHFSEGEYLRLATRHPSMTGIYVVKAIVTNATADSPSSQALQGSSTTLGLLCFP